MGSVMDMRQPEVRQHSHAYELFILVLTVLSLVVMVVMLLPLDDATIGMLQFYDNLICVIFLIDFVIRMTRVDPKSDYFIRERGWLDLLGSIPSLGVAFRYTGSFRLRPPEPPGPHHATAQGQATRRDRQGRPRTTAASTPCSSPS